MIMFHGALTESPSLGRLGGVVAEKGDPGRFDAISEPSEELSVSC